MAHKTRVNGTNYEITSGETLVGGTAYSIAGGRTLVGGTAYDVPFEFEYHNVHMWARGAAQSSNDNSKFDDTLGYVTIGGVKYTAENTISVRKRKTISLTVSATHSDQQYRCQVYFNGNLVQDGAGTYSWPVNGATDIEIIKTSTIVNWKTVYWWSAYITQS